MVALNSGKSWQLGFAPMRLTLSGGTFPRGCSLGGVSIQATASGLTATRGSAGRGGGSRSGIRVLWLRDQGNG